MFRSRNSAASLAKAARELERQMMTMEVVSGDEEETAEQSPSSAAGERASVQQVELPDRLCFGPYGIAPLRGLHFAADQDKATS